MNILQFLIKNHRISCNNLATTSGKPLKMSKIILNFRRAIVIKITSESHNSDHVHLKKNNMKKVLTILRKQFENSEMFERMLLAVYFFMCFYFQRWSKTLFQKIPLCDFKIYYCTVSQTAIKPSYKLILYFNNKT